MKKLAYITMIAALIFGIQTPESVAAAPNTMEEAKEGKGQARISYHSSSETLIIEMFSGMDKEKVQVMVSVDGINQVKEEFVITRDMNEYIVDLSGLKDGIYFVKIGARTFDFNDRFRKK